MSPRDQEKLFSKEYGKELFGIAKGDLESAELLAEAKGGRPENVCYLIQQSMEKAVKAVLCVYKTPIPFVHDLGILIAKLPDGVSPPEGYRLAQFNQYATVRRYEEGDSAISPEDIRTAIAIGQKVIAWAEKEINA